MSNHLIEHKQSNMVGTDMGLGRTVTMKGNTRNLVGTGVASGSKAPDFSVIDTGMRKRSIADYAGKTLIISAVPSIDTGVCQTETRRFNEIASMLGDDVVILTISADLPFAQRRWCGAEGIDKVQMLSDHREVSFGKNYGVLIEADRLLARCIFVIDSAGIVRYTQLVPEVSTEPDYDDVIQAVKAVV